MDCYGVIMIYGGVSRHGFPLLSRGYAGGWGMCGETEIPRSMEICVEKQRCLEA